MFNLCAQNVYQEEIKKSRFIAKAAPVSSPADALAFLERIRQTRATHHCWAYKLDQDYRFSDDGEPSGTAGRPILNAIQRQSIDRVMVVVIRYFGGIKLGAGGLVRAYGGCAAKCLRAATLRRSMPMATLRLQAGFDHIGVLYATIDRFGAVKIEENFTENGLVVGLQIDRKEGPALLAALKDASAGQIQMLDPNGSSIRPRHR